MLLVNFVKICISNEITAQPPIPIVPFFNFTQACLTNKETKESTLSKYSLVPLMHHDPRDLGNAKSVFGFFLI